MGRVKIASPPKVMLSRTQRFLQVERLRAAEGSHPAARHLVARPRLKDPARRVAQFIRIARGHLA